MNIWRNWQVVPVGTSVRHHREERMPAEQTEEALVCARSLVRALLEMPTVEFTKLPERVFVALQDLNRVLKGERLNEL